VTLLGSNKLLDGGFDDASKWAITVSGPNVITVTGGILTYQRSTGAPTNIRAIAFVPVIGRTYQIKFKVLRQAGPGSPTTQLGGFNNAFSGTGIKTQYVTPVNTNQFFFSEFTNTSDYQIDWVSIREVGIDMSKLVLTMRDFDGDKRQTSIELGEVTDGTSYTTISGQASTLATAIQAVCAGKRAKQEFVATSTAPDDTNAANVLAQTSYRWIIEYNDFVTGDGPYQIDLPTPDLADNSLVLAGSHHHDPANAEWVTLKAAMEGGEVKNPRTGNNIVITAIFLEQ
jgi:hypothetical protein